MEYFGKNDANLAVEIASNAIKIYNRWKTVIDNNPYALSIYRQILDLLANIYLAAKDKDSFVYIIERFSDISRTESHEGNNV